MSTVDTLRYNLVTVAVIRTEMVREMLESIGMPAEDDIVKARREAYEAVARLDDVLRAHMREINARKE